MQAAALNVEVEMQRVPAGALRILSRRKGSQILILEGEDRPVETRLGERLAYIEWFKSADVAAAISRHCSQLLIDANFRPSAEGWHDFHEDHIKTVVGVAKNHLNVTLFVPNAKVVAERQAWTRERVARLGFLIGLGWTAKKIADDELIRSTPNNVYRQAHRFGLSLSEGPQGQICVRLPVASMAVYDRAASAVRLTRDAFVRRFLIASAADPDRLGLLERA